MLENDPTKNGFYLRCPLFGDYQCIDDFIKDDRPNISNCLMIARVVRSRLIYPFLPRDPSSHVQFFPDPYYCHEFNSDYFNGEPYPDPQIIEKRIGYPAAYTMAFRVIYWRLTKIESECLDRFTRMAEYAREQSAVLLSLNYDDNSFVTRALAINGNIAADRAKDTVGVEFEARQIINSTRMFQLFALKNAIEAIRDNLVYEKSDGTQSHSKEYYQAALTYMKRVENIEAEVKVISESEPLIIEGKIRRKQLTADKNKKNKALLKYCNELMQANPSSSAAHLWSRIPKKQKPKIIDGTKIYRVDGADRTDGEEKIYCISPDNKQHSLGIRAFFDYYTEIKNSLNFNS